MGDHIKDLTEGVEEGTVWDGGGHRYQLEKVVGNGAFGIVWRARAEDGDVVAIKKVMLDRRYHNRELQMMKVMEHENVVRLRHYFEKAGRKKDETFLHLVMDYLPETIRSVALKHHKRAKRFHADHIKAYLSQTFKALEYIHARRICHRDIKPDNLLCDPNSLKCQLCDFGCSKVLVKGQPNVSYICSRYYRAPELMFGATEYSVAVDVWSVGTILMELLLGHLPFQGQDSTQQHLVEIMKLLGTPTDRDLQAMRATCSAEDLPKLKAYPWERVFPANTPPEAVDLAQRLLRYDPDERLTATMALAHPFFDGVEQLLGGSSSSSAPPISREPSRVKEKLPAEDWQKLVTHIFAESVPPLRVDASALAAAANGSGDELANNLVKQFLRPREQELGACLATIQAKLAEASSRYALPGDGGGGGGGGGGASGAGGGGDDSAEARDLQAQIDELKAASRELQSAQAEKADLAARLKGAKAQLTAPSGEETPDKVAHHGRRAPAPTRQATGVDGAGDSGRAALPAASGDNLGQVAPLGAPSISPEMRASSSSGRRRPAEGGGEAQ